MDARLSILGISGSLRRDSYNTALLRATRTLLPDIVSFSVGDIGDLPLYNPDVEVQGFPPAVVGLREQLLSADGVLFASPEYNWSITGALKNAIDWASRPPQSPLDHVPAAIISGGGRSGGARSQAHLREVLAHNRAQVLEEPEVLVPRVWEAFTDGILTSERVWDDLRALAGAFVEHIVRDHAHRPSVVVLGRRGDVMARTLHLIAGDYRVRGVLTDEDAMRLIAERNPAAVVIGGGVERASRDAVAAHAALVAPGAAVVDVAGPDSIADRLAEALG
jgi:chromate reductase